MTIIADCYLSTKSRIEIKSVLTRHMVFMIYNIYNDTRLVTILFCSNAGPEVWFPSKEIFINYNRDDYIENFAVSSPSQECLLFFLLFKRSHEVFVRLFKLL